LYPFSQQREPRRQNWLCSAEAPCNRPDVFCLLPVFCKLALFHTMPHETPYRPPPVPCLLRNAHTDKTPGQSRHYVKLRQILAKEHKPLPCTDLGGRQGTTPIKAQRCTDSHALRIPVTLCEMRSPSGSEFGDCLFVWIVGRETRCPRWVRFDPHNSAQSCTVVS
jgi:hypothetical protein